MKRFLLYFFLSILFGIISTLSMEPFYIPFIRWFILWFLFYFGEKFYKSSLKSILSISFLLALSLCIFTFYWVIHLFKEYGGIPLYLSIFLFIPYSFLLNLKIPFILILLTKIKRKFLMFRYYNFLWIPLIITIIDIITPQVFHWYWGNALSNNLIFSQIADLFGIHGITFFYVLFSYVFYRIFKLFIKTGLKILKNKRFIKIYSVYIILLILIYIYGIFQFYRYKEISEKSLKIRIASIQANAPLEKYGENKVTKEVIENLMLNTIPELMKTAYEKGEKKIDLFVLPESAIPYYTTQKNSFTMKYNLYHPYFEYLILSSNAKFNSDIFFNEFYYDIDLNKKRIDSYNSSALFSRIGKREVNYHKRKLIAFGEQIPFAEFLDSTGLISLVPESVRYSRFQPGSEFTSIPYMISKTSEIKEKEFSFSPLDVLIKEKEVQEFFKNRTFEINGYFMPLICYEVIQTDYVRDFFNHSKNKIDFIVNITQDRWYGKTIESYQHLALAKFRSIELRRAMIRSTNSGVSAAINLNGEYLKPFYGEILTKQEVEDFQIFDLPIYKDSDTMYTKIGNSWLLVILILYLILLWLKLKK